MLVVAWLNQINFRICFQLHKKQKRYVAEMADYSDTNTDGRRSPVALQTEPGFFHTPDENNPEDMVVKVDSREYIMNQIMKLPFTEAQVIILKFYRNLKYDEIANLMDISRSSVKRYLNSGKSHLAKVFQQQGGDLIS